MLLSSPAGVTLESLGNGTVKTTLQGEDILEIQSISNTAMTHLSAGHIIEKIERELDGGRLFAYVASHG